MSVKSSSSYAQILKASSLIGGAQGVNMLVGMVRIKVIAILIGPIGLGLLETYKTIMQVINAIAGLGVKSSAVRSVAEAIASGDEEKLGRTVLTLRRVCRLTGIIGFFAVVLLSRPLSQMTFNTTEHAFSIACAGLTVLFFNLYAGQMALIQGMRRIGDLAKLNAFGSIAGTVVSLLLYAWLGLQGIVPAIVALSLLQLCVSWLFVRKINVPQVTMGWSDSIVAAGGMVKLGLAFMWNALLVALTAYVIRTFIAREIDLVSVGIYAAAFSLSGIIVNFILEAMAADYYPGLTVISKNHAKMRRMVNEQTEIGLLLAIPSLLLLLCLAPWVVKVFYSSAFSGSANLLQWFVLGCLGRVISWPMAFVMLAKGKAKLFASVETFGTIMHLVFVFVFLFLWGIEGVSVAFVLLYFFYTLTVFMVARHLIGFTWSKGVLRLFSLLMPIVIGIFLASRFLPGIPTSVAGVLVAGITGMYCLRELMLRVGKDHFICRLVETVPILNSILSRDV